MDELNIDDLRKCSKCGIVKSADRFSGTKSKSYCKDCVNVYGRAHYRRNAEKSKAKATKWKEEHRDRAKYIRWRCQLKLLYGITIEKYEEMLKDQNGLCYICNKQETRKGRLNLSVDHNHTTKQIRKLVCSKCNVGIGMFNEDPLLLRKTADYIESFDNQKMVEGG